MALVPPSNRGTDPSANVDSVFGRTGVVVATAGDYVASQVTNAADKASAATQTFTGSLVAPAGKTITADAAAASARIGAVGPSGEAALLLGTDTAIYRVNAGAIDVQGSLAVDAGANITNVCRANGGFKTGAITAGALPTVAPVSTTAFQCLTARDVFLVVPVTYTLIAGTCKVELSPDNVTYSTIVTYAPASAGAVDTVQLQVPAGWYVKLTTTNAVLGTGTYY